MAKHKMRRGTKMVVVTLTVVVVAGGIAFGKFGGGFDARADRVVHHVERELNLDPTQSASLRALKSELSGLRREVRQNRDEEINALFALVTASRFDQQEALAMIEDKTRVINSRAPELVSIIARFLDSLSPDQKAILNEHLRDKQDKLNHMRRWHS
jgi:Spy/CpxP family protein refolding chaperone